MLRPLANSHGQMLRRVASKVQGPKNERIAEPAQRVRSLVLRGRMPSRAIGPTDPLTRGCTAAGVRGGEEERIRAYPRHPDCQGFAAQGAKWRNRIIALYQRST